MINLTACHIRVALCLALVTFTVPALAQEAAPEQSLTAAAVAPAEAAEAVPEVLPPANPLPLDKLTQHMSYGTAVVTSGDTKINMPYFWYPPDQPWAEGATFPLVLVLHGAAGYAEAANALITSRNLFPAFIVVPALPKGRRWADPGKLTSSHALPETVELVKQFIAKNPAVDPKRVYVVGCDTGGTGAFGAAQLYSDVFAAAVAVAATWSRHETSNMKNVPLAAFHGVDDTVVPLTTSRDTITTVQQAGGTAFFTKFDYMEHECEVPDVYNDRLWGWMFQQKKSDAP